LAEQAVNRLGLCFNIFLNFSGILFAEKLSGFKTQYRNALPTSCLGSFEPMPGLGRIPKHWPELYCWAHTVRCGGATRDPNPTRSLLWKKRTAPAAAAASEVQCPLESHSADRRDKVSSGKLNKAKRLEMEWMMKEAADPELKGDQDAAAVVLVVSLRIL
jgi:hypothetical protein